MPACAQSVLDDGAAVLQALQLGAAAVAGRWQPSADGSHYLQLPGAAWRALPHLIGSEAYQKDHGLGLNGVPPASVAGARRGAGPGDDDSLDESVDSEGDLSDSSSVTSSTESSAASSELTDTEAAGSSSSYEAVTDDEALRRRREETSGLTGLIAVRSQPAAHCALRA